MNFGVCQHHAEIGDWQIFALKILLNKRNLSRELEEIGIAKKIPFCYLNTRGKTKRPNGRRSRKMGMKKGIAIIIFSALIIAALSLTLPAKLRCRIAGVVVDKETGEPVSGANIYIRQGERTRYCLSWQNAYDLKTDAFGRFSQILRYDGTYTVYCQNEGYVTFKPDRYSYLNEDGDAPSHKDFDVAEGEVKFLRIELERGGTLQGTFKLETGEKIPIGPIEIDLYRNIPGENGKEKMLAITDALTNESGSFKIDNLKAGDDYLVYISPGDGYPRKKIENITIVKNNVTDISNTFLLPLNTCLQGRVMVKCDNGYYSYVWIQMESKAVSPEIGEAQGFYEGVQVLDSETGEYCFRGLQPGIYKIVSLLSIGSERLKKIEDTVEIKSGAIVTKNIHLP